MKIKGVLLALTVLGVLPLELRAQTSQQGEPFQGFYVGVEGGVNWLVNSGYNMNTGWAAGGVVGYDFVGPRFEIEGVFRSNYGTGASTPGTSATSTPPVTSCDSGGVCTTTAAGTTTPGTPGSTISGKIEQLAFMANGYYDFMPGATFVPYVGAGVGIAFADGSITGCSLCSTQFAYQGIVGLAWNFDQNIRFHVDGRYFGTTSPVPYTNSNFTVMAGVTYKFGQGSVSPLPAPPIVMPPSFMVFFDWDRSNLSAQALNTIKQAAQAYKSKGNAGITATGHTDTSGPEAYNMALSLRRANTVKDVLVREGVPATAVTVIGKGETGLLVQTADGVREPQNRRVEIVIQ